MAKVAFFNIPAHGHVNPTLPLVAELVRRGESVVYYNTEAFRDEIEKTGAEFRRYAIDENYDFAKIAAVPIELICALQELSVKLLPQLLDDLKRDPVDYLIHDSACPWGNYIAQISGLPTVCSHTTFAMRPELFAEGGALARLWRVSARLLPRLPLVPRIRRARRQLKRTYGVEARDVLFKRVAQLNVVYTSREFHPKAELYDESYQFVGVSLDPPGEPEEWVRELGDAGLIYVSLGTIFNEAKGFYRTCFEALGSRPERVVMATGAGSDIGALGTLPSNFIVHPWVPQLSVLSRASLFLTRGGLNSVSEALLCGVPMLVFPKISEQELNARQVGNLGAGLVLNDRTVSVGEMRSKVSLVLNDPRFAEAARRLGASLRDAGGYTKAADAILCFRERTREPRA